MSSRALEHQVQQGALFRELAWKALKEEPTGHFRLNEVIAFALLAQLLETHEAIELLVKKLLVNDAWSLVRTSAECAVNCAYMFRVAADSTVQDFVDYSHYKIFAESQRLKAIDPDVFRSIFSQEEEQTRRKLFESVRARFEKRRGDKWCIDDRLYKRAIEVDNFISNKWNVERHNFLLIAQTVWTWGSAHTHAAVEVVMPRLTGSKEKMFFRSYADEEAAEALLSGTFTLYMLLSFIDDELGGKNAKAIQMRCAEWRGPINFAHA
jgi:hypothetical protein